MKMDFIPSRIWFVHNNNKLDTMWTTRNEARTRASSIRSADSNAKTSISYSTLETSTVTRSS